MKQRHVGKEANPLHPLCLEHNILHTGFFSFASKVRIFQAVLSDSTIETDLHYICKGSFRQLEGMKIANRIVTIFRLYLRNDTCFPKSNLFGHSYNSMCCLFKVLYLIEFLLLFSLLNVLLEALFSMQSEKPKNSFPLSKHLLNICYIQGPGPGTCGAQKNGDSGDDVCRHLQSLMTY